jgi:hypothetical protein
MFTWLFASAIIGIKCARHTLNGGAQKIKKHGEQGWNVRSYGGKFRHVSCNLDSPWNSPQPSGVAVETVRTQIKAIMAKLGVSRQVDLVVRLGEL